MDRNRHKYFKVAICDATRFKRVSDALTGLFHRSSPSITKATYKKQEFLSAAVNIKRRGGLINALISRYEIRTNNKITYTKMGFPENWQNVQLFRIMLKNKGRRKRTDCIRAAAVCQANFSSSSDNSSHRCSAASISSFSCASEICRFLTFAAFSPIM